MIRVAFVIATAGDGWIGGANYYINLLNAIRLSPRVRPVILTGPDARQAVAARFPEVDIVESPWVDASRRLVTARRAVEKLYGRAVVLESLLRRNDIDVLSHSGQLGARSRFPSIGWIPDFQHMRLPALFSAKERRVRDGVFRRLADNCTRVVVSSKTALGDLETFRRGAGAKAHVLHFVPGFHNAIEDRDGGAGVLAQHGIEGPYFHLPNQFWRHKNHAIVIDALARLRGRARRVTVVATGHTDDYRSPGHFEDLMQRAAELGVADDFRVLNVVPYPHLVALMRSSVAIINPSLFEGWSTTVEEAKALGKTVLLSDIPVHREQAPEHGAFFDPTDADQLADLMADATDTFSPEREIVRAERARRALPDRLAAFAKTYEDVVLDAAASR